MIALSGVRSSWLMFARNWLLARLAISAASRALSSSRMSRRMPIAPITRPWGSRRADALSVVGIESPEADRGLRRASRVTPLATTSRSAAVNSRVSSGLINRESDCSITSSGRKPSNSDTASLAWRILPSRSETNTGSGANLMRLSAYARALSSSRISRRMPMAPITRPSGARRAEAFRVVGMISPLALRGLSRASRVPPLATTSRSAAVNSRVSSGEINRDSDCSITSSARKPSNFDTASFAWRILPSRSETNTGSGALAMIMSAPSERSALPVGAVVRAGGGLFVAMSRLSLAPVSVVTGSLNHQHRQVIVSGLFPAPAFHCEDQAAEYLAERKVSRLLQRCLEPPVAVVFAVRVPHFSESIGVEEKSVAHLQRDAVLLVRSIPHSNWEAGHLQPGRLSTFGEVNRPRMASRDKPELACVEREDAVEERERVSGGRFWGQVLIKSRGDLRWWDERSPITACDSCEQVAGSHRQKRRRDTVPAHVEHT